MTEMDVKRIKAGNFARNNGQVLQAVNILRIKFNKLAGIERVLKSSGMAPDEFLESVNFLAEEGYIRLRYISTKETATLADAEYTALEAKLTGKGIRLRAGGIDDDMVEVSSSDRRLLRAGNFVQNNGGVLRPLNILSHKYNKLGNLQSLLAGEGVAEDEFLDSVNFLASEGYITFPPNNRKYNDEERNAKPYADYAEENRGKTASCEQYQGRKRADQPNGH